MDVAVLSSWLKKQYEITVKQEWIENVTQQNVKALPREMLCKKLYHAYLHSDIRESGAGALPKNLKSEKKCLLQETYCLQMNSLKDVSSPAYGQLQKLKGVDTSNVAVSAEVLQPKWEQPQRGQRVLVLELSDGTQSVRAMELNTINQLSTNMKPGCKLLVKGPVKCRNGMLMLRPASIKVLGGFVQKLLADNSQIRILSSAIGQEHNDDSVVNRAPANVPLDESPTTSMSSTVTSAAATSNSENPFPNDDEIFDEIDMNEALESDLKAWEEDMDNNLMDEHMKLNPAFESSSTDGQKVVELSAGNVQCDEKSDRNDKCSAQKKEKDRTSSALQAPPPMCQPNQTNFQDIPTSSTPSSSSLSSKLSAKKKQSSLDHMFGDKVKTSQEQDSSVTCSNYDADFQHSKKKWTYDDFDDLDDFDESEICLTSKMPSPKQDELVKITDLQQLLKTDATRKSAKTKAFLFTLTSKLKTANSRWSVDVQITDDGVTLLEVTFSNCVLERLIGYSVKDYMSLKVRYSGDDLLMEKKNIDKGIKECQAQLAQLCGIFTIERQVGASLPVITHVQATDDDQLNKQMEKLREQQKLSHSRK